MLKYDGWKSSPLNNSKVEVVKSRGLCCSFCKYLVSPSRIISHPVRVGRKGEKQSLDFLWGHVYLLVKVPREPSLAWALLAQVVERVAPNRSSTEQWEIWCRSSLFWLTLSHWGGWQICGELRELLGRKDKPLVVSPKGEGKGQSATGRTGGRWRVKGAGTWGWELEEQLNFVSKSQYAAPKCKGWHFGYCWGKLSPRLSATPFCA